MANRTIIQIFKKNFKWNPSIQQFRKWCKYPLLHFHDYAFTTTKIQANMSAKKSGYNEKRSRSIE